MVPMESLWASLILNLIQQQWSYLLYYVYTVIASTEGLIEAVSSLKTIFATNYTAFLFDFSQLGLAKADEESLASLLKNVKCVCNLLLSSLPPFFFFLLLLPLLPSSPSSSSSW